MPTPRRTLGQVFTPPAVAAFMVRWAAEHRPRRILDPSLGQGVFVHELRAIETNLRRGASVTACEVDPAMVADFRNAKRKTQPLLVDIRLTDFLSASFDAPFDAIICNPPYIRHHDANRNESTFRRFDRLAGQRLSRLTNDYGLFLVRIWSLLAEAGRAAVIMPAEWLNADFGRTIKAHLLRENAIDRIIHFEHAADVFDGVMTTAAIVLLRRGRDAAEPLRFETVGAPDELVRPPRSIEYRAVDLDPGTKWTPLFTARPTSERGLIRLGEIARCTRGIATGANQYFVLKPSELEAAGIDRRDVTVCIAKATQVPRDRLTRDDMQSLIDADERIFLLTPRQPLAPAAARYLNTGKRLAIDRRYLPAHRPVWYQPEHRKPAPIWVNVFARNGFRFVRNEAGALHLTCFHAIYPKAGVSPDRLHTELCRRATHDRLAAETRIYAAGLSKLEPRDVECIRIPAAFAKPAKLTPTPSRSDPKKSSRRAANSRRPAVPSCPG